MKAVVCSRLDGPEALTVGEHPDPVAGEGQVHVPQGVDLAEALLQVLGLDRRSLHEASASRGSLSRIKF